MVVGHQKIIDFFKRGVRQQKLAHAFLFVGPAKVGKKTTAMAVAKIIQGLDGDGSNPDLYLVEPQVQETDDAAKKDSEIRIDQIRDLQYSLGLSPYNAKAKVAIISEAQAISQEAATALLKTLEEPPNNSYIILISSDWHRILPTIISRCQLIKFNLVSIDLIEKYLAQNDGGGKAKLYARLAAGRPGVAIDYLSNKDKIKADEKIIESCRQLQKASFYERFELAQNLCKNFMNLKYTLEVWQLYFRDIMLAGAGCDRLVLNSAMVKNNQCDIIKSKEAINKIRATLKIIQNPSFNLKLAVENLFLSL